MVVGFSLDYSIRQLNKHTMSISPCCPQEETSHLSSSAEEETLSPLCHSMELK